MTKYEVMVIIKSDLDEKSAKAHFTDHVAGLIKAAKGSITFDDFWGSRGFAYQIKNYKWGYYGVFQFDMDPSETASLRRELRLDNNVLRSIIIKVDKNAPEPKKYADMKKEYEALEKKVAEETKEEAKPTREKLTTVAEKKEDKPEAKKEEAPKDELDKKLEAVIDDASVDL